MKNSFLVSSIFLLVFAAQSIYSQCSDAGICTLGGYHADEENTLFDVGVGYNYGYSGKDDEINYHSFVFDAKYQFSPKTSFAVKLPFNSQSGPLGDVNGIGDIIIGVSHFIDLDGSAFSFSAGAKLSTGKDDVDDLPQMYQSGLGSTDILFGLDYSINKLNVGIGYQIAGKRNSNILQLERGDDLLVRGGYSIELDKFRFLPQVLIIKRLGKSTVLDSTLSRSQNEYIEVEDSDQLQVNLLLANRYIINNNYSILLDLAVPFLKREVNVDGLTRAFSVKAGLLFSF